MTEREKEPITRPSDPQLMSNPAEKQTFVDPAEPKATTAFPTILVVVAVLAITIVALAVMLLLRYQ